MTEVLIVYFIVLAIMLASLWTIFEKAGEPGWAILIPIYSLIVMCRIAGRPGHFWLFCLIPIVNIVFIIMLLADLAKSFGKGGGFVVLLILLPFVGYPILAFTEEYIGPGGRRRRGVRRRSRDDDYDDQDYDRPRKRKRRDDDDEDYDRPRRSSREDEDDEDRPRKRSRREDDDDDDRPRRRSRYDDDTDRPFKRSY